MNPYQTLNLPSTATDQEIQTAYKRLAMQRHPDRETGNEEAFKQLQQAYAILSDPIRRAKYDATGDISETPSPEVHAKIELIKLFENVLVNSVQDDIIAEMHNILVDSIRNVIKAKTNLTKLRKRLRKSKGNITYVKTDNIFVHNIIATKRKEVWANYKQLRNNLSVLRLMKALLQDFKYTGEPEETLSPFGQSPFGGLGKFNTYTTR